MAVDDEFQAYLDQATQAVQAGLRAIPFDDRYYVPEKALLILAHQRGVDPGRLQALMAAGWIRPQRRRGWHALYNLARTLDRLPYVEELQRGPLPPGVAQALLAFEHAWEEELWARLQATRQREFAGLAEGEETTVRLQVVQSVSVVERVNRLREEVRQGHRLSGQAARALAEWCQRAGELAPDVPAEAVAEVQRRFLPPGG